MVFWGCAGLGLCWAVLCCSRAVLRYAGVVLCSALLGWRWSELSYVVLCWAGLCSVFTCCAGLCWAGAVCVGPRPSKSFASCCLGGNGAALNGHQPWQRLGQCQGLPPGGLRPELESAAQGQGLI